MPLAERPGAVPGELLEKLRTLPKRERAALLKAHRRARMDEKAARRAERAPKVRQVKSDHPQRAKLEAARAARQR